MEEARPILLVSSSQDNVLSTFDEGDPVRPALILDWEGLPQERQTAITAAKADMPPNTTLMLVGSAQALLLPEEDGEEMFCADDKGKTPFDSLIERYATLGRDMKSTGCDVMLITDLPDVVQGRAAVLGGRQADMQVWVTADIDRDGDTMDDGSDILATFLTLQGLGASSFGFGRPDSTELILPGLERIAPFATMPLLARPECVTGEEERVMTSDEYAEMTGKYMALGVSICGGGYGASARHLLAVKEVLAKGAKQTAKWGDEDDLLLCTHREVFFLDSNLELSEAVRCEGDMAEELLGAEDEGCDVVCVQIESVDDGALLAHNSYLLGLPVAFWADDLQSLETALYYYPGRAMIDSRSALQREELAKLATRYGGVVV